MIEPGSKSKKKDVEGWASRRKDRDREERVWKQTQEEAANAGATLSHDHPGGVDVGVALHVFRRGGEFGAWRCEICGSSENLELDHMDGHPEITPEEPDRKHADTPGNLIAICRSCHDQISQANERMEQGAE